MAISHKEQVVDIYGTVFAHDFSPICNDKFLSSHIYYVRKFGNRRFCQGNFKEKIKKGPRFVRDLRFIRFQTRTTIC